jgi:KDO2-lipid IV(A) lauroyltransferase
LNSSTIPDRRPAVDYLYRILTACSTRCLFRISAWLAFFVYHVKNKLSTLARNNIDLCFPRLAIGQRRALARESIHNTCCAFFELATLWYHPLDQVLGLVDEQHVDPGFTTGSRGSIIIAPHHGSWELLNLWLAERESLYSLYKPTRSARLDRYVLARRSRNGAQLVPVSTGGLRRLLKGLRSGANVMILPDQRPGAEAARIDAPFFGHPAPTSLLIKNLVSKVDCDIYIAAMTRKLESGRYALTISALDREQLLEDDYTSAAYLNRSIEEFVMPSVGQ